MARISLKEVDKYGTSGNDYFHLSNDKDTANIRMLIRSMDELEIYAVHYVDAVSDNGNKYQRKVECLEPQGQECPLCKADNYQAVKIFIPVIHEGIVKIWERGKTFIPKITSNFKRYAEKDSGLMSREFEVQRNGEKGSTDTTYELFVLEKDDFNFDESDFEYPKIEGELVDVVSSEEMLKLVDGEQVQTTAKKPSKKIVVKKRTKKDNIETF